MARANDPRGYNLAVEAFQKVDLDLQLPPGFIQNKVQAALKVSIKCLLSGELDPTVDRRYWAPERMKGEWHDGCAAVYQASLTAISDAVKTRVTDRGMTHEEAVNYTQNGRITQIFKPLVTFIDSILQ